ncbi:MAG: hypothetical protein HY954_12325 [Deltaproteobacteria bacterium]|nr:hypothetical protein [Deltaproteobacteria bacterium]
MATEIREFIKVVAVFEEGIRPVKFKWKGRVYPIKEITCRWASKEGSATIMHFSVTDGAALFEITYNQASLRWTLEEVEV